MSYRFNKFNRGFTRAAAGFTLIEMIVVIAIFGIVTTIILANLPTFRDRSSLDLVAQEVAINIRGAQVYGASGRVQSEFGSKPTWRVFFDQAKFTPRSSFQLFRDDGQNRNPIETYNISGNFIIESVCLVEVSGGGCNSKNQLGIAFSRPNLEPKFYDGTNFVDGAVSAQVLIKALRSGETRRVEIFNNGQISVVNPQSVTTNP